MWDFEPLLASNICSYKCVVISESLCITFVVEAASLNDHSFSQRSNADATVQTNPMATLNSPVIQVAFFNFIFFGADGRRENFCQMKTYLYCFVVHIVAIDEQLSKIIMQ
jgi:hypothetical protein